MHRMLAVTTLLLIWWSPITTGEVRWVSAPTLVTQDPSFSQIPLTLHTQWGNSLWYTQTSLGLTRQQSPWLTRETSEGLGARLGAGIQMGHFTLSVDLQFQQQPQQNLTVLGFNTEVKF